MTFRLARDRLRASDRGSPRPYIKEKFYGHFTAFAFPEKELPVQEKEVKIKRLSQKARSRLSFPCALFPTTVPLRYGEWAVTMSKLHIVLAGVKSPDLKNQELLDHYGAATPAELLKLLLLPGEIEDLCIRNRETLRISHRYG